MKANEGAAAQERTRLLSKISWALTGLRDLETGRDRFEGVFDVDAAQRGYLREMREAVSELGSVLGLAMTVEEYMRPCRGR